MQLNTVNHATLVQFVAAGVVKSATIKGQDSSWILTVKVGDTSKVLLSKSRKMREFKRMETLVMYLKEIGIVKFSVDSERFNPKQRTIGRGRPDRSIAMKAIHLAAKK